MAHHKGRAQVAERRDKERGDATERARVDVAHHAGELLRFKRHLTAQGGGEHDGDKEVGHGQHARTQRLRNHDFGEDTVKAHAQRAGGFHLANADGVDAAHKVLGAKGRAQKDRGDDNAGAVGQDDLERRQRVDDDDKQRDARDVTEDLDIQVAKDAQRLERRHAHHGDGDGQHRGDGKRFERHAPGC